MRRQCARTRYDNSVEHHVWSEHGYIEHHLDLECHDVDDHQLGIQHSVFTHAAPSDGHKRGQL